MTKEQGETIEILKQDLELAKKEDVIDIDVLTGHLEIALNLIQEQQEENKKKDKIIDYMIDWIRERSIYAVDSHDMLKQYFERKVEDGN